MEIFKIENNEGRIDLLLEKVEKFKEDLNKDLIKSENVEIDKNNPKHVIYTIEYDTKEINKIDKIAIKIIGDILHECTNHIKYNMNQVYIFNNDSSIVLEDESGYLPISICHLSDSLNYSTIDKITKTLTELNFNIIRR